MRFISNFQDFSLNETTLNLAELSKAGKTKPRRGDVLIDKIESDSPLIIDKTNKPIKIDKLKDTDGEWVEPDEAIINMTNSKGGYDEDSAKRYLSVGRRYKKVFKGEDDEEYQLNSFKKTADFGSSGAGSLTKDFESVQCIFMAIRQSANYALNSNNMISAFHNYEELSNDFGPLVFLPSGISVTQDMIEKFSSDRNWSHTFCRVPNMLWSSDRLIDVDINYSIYHVGYKGSDSPYIAILSKYKSFSKSGGFGDINIAKFCPADVYMISIERRDSIMSDIESTKNISELILTINKHFNNRTLVPISLKKVLSGTKCSIIINNETNAEPVEFEFSHVEITNDPMTGISSKLVANSMWRKMKKVRKMNFDSPDTTKKANVDGEVEGSASRHGKISLKYINKYIDEKRKIYNSLPKINSYQELSLLSEYELKNKLATSYGEVERYYNNVDKSLTRGKKLDTINKKISKIQSLQISHCLLKLNRINSKEANDLICDLFKYALSIQTPSFMSPKYLRVI